MRHSLGVRSCLWLVVAVAAACGELRSPAAFRQRTPHESYEDALRAAGLASTALGRDWFDAAARALRRPVPVTLPFREAVYFAAETPDAVGYQLGMRRGERLRVELAADGTPVPRLFVDLFRAAPDTAGGPRHEASADSAAATLEFEAERDGTFILRVQPELLRAARVRVSASVGPALAFPVAGRDSRAVQSFWGAARDRGQRSHQGVDIFAPRGTPALAAADGWITAVRTTQLGGNVVWLWDPERQQSLYYAHLDRQLVGRGDRVRAGDTLGLVGNTGNARTTAPHLHFGIYRRGEGPIDPYRWVHRPRDIAPRIAGDLGALGQLRRSGRSPVTLRAGPQAETAAVAVLAPGTPVRIAGAAGASFRVSLPDRLVGYLPARALEQMERPIRTERVRIVSAVRERPAAGAVVVDSLPAGSAVEILAQFADYRLVRTRSGLLGWMGTD